MMAVRVQTPTLAIGAPELLFSDPGTFLSRPPTPGGPAARAWDIAPDGRFLMVKGRPGEPAGNNPTGNIIHVLNWHEELKRLVPTK
jgi:hypothetical protein